MIIKKIWKRMKPKLLDEVIPPHEGTDTTAPTTTVSGDHYKPVCSRRGESDGWEVLCDLPDPGLLQEVQEEEGERRPEGRARLHQPLCRAGLRPLCSARAAVCRAQTEPVLVCWQLCKAGLKTLQDLGPEMRLALNEDLEEEEEAVMEDEELLEVRRIPIPELRQVGLSSNWKCVSVQDENGLGADSERRGSLLTPTGKRQHHVARIILESRHNPAPNCVQVPAAVTV